ncbi:hypothetical protein MNBD_GAMMA24-136 [hydrothermal vent metagenome]|uniref:Uncharacterized protein n=1 Tax=hydrothermal vent metagenome TaxID=652676 RepID=A0A3B1BE13_9ZZZZ
MGEWVFLLKQVFQYAVRVRGEVLSLTKRRSVNVEMLKMICLIDLVLRLRSGRTVIPKPFVLSEVEGNLS